MSSSFWFSFAQNDKGRKIKFGELGHKFYQFYFKNQIYPPTQSYGLNVGLWEILQQKVSFPELLKDVEKISPF